MEDPILLHCQAVIERGSRSFSRAAALLPPESRTGAYLLYAWCRHCDDVADGQELGTVTPGTRLPQHVFQARLDDLRARTERVLAGGTDELLVFQGLGRIVKQFGIPHRHPRELLDGMVMDVEARRYQTLDELAVYCYHAAGVVGVMMAHIMGIRDSATLKRAEDLGIAFQLTNIARDIKDDAAMGRVYLPLDWLQEANLAVEAVQSAAANPQLAVLVGRLLETAEQHYAAVDRGIGHLPFRQAWAMSAARYIYSDIGRAIVERGPNAWDRRAFVSGLRKTRWVLVSLFKTIGRATWSSSPPG